MIKKIFSSSKNLLIGGSIVLALALSMVIWNGYQQAMDYRAQHIKQEGEQLVIEIENFLQIGYVYTNSYAASLDLNGNSDSVVIQLRRLLLPFPFFNQVSITDSDGNIIAGFPQNNIGQRQEGFPSDKAALFNDVSTIPRRNQSSQVLFIKEVKKPDTSAFFYLIAESDLRANPLNSGLQRVIASLNSKDVNVVLKNEAGERTLNLLTLETPVQNEGSLERLNQKIALNGWSLELVFMNRVEFNAVLVSSLPLIIVLFFIQMIFVSNYLTAKQKDNALAEFANIDNKELEPAQGRKTSFKLKLAEVMSLNDMAQLLLNYAELKEETSIRLVLFLNPFYKNGQRMLCFGRGRDSDEFSYLDEQIGILLEKHPLLEFHDISGSREIHLRQDRKYPRAIFAAPIISEKTSYGFIWYGFENPGYLNSEDKKYIQEIIEIGKRILIFFQKYQTLKDISETQNLIIESIPSPVLLLDESDAVMFSNQQAIKVFGFKEEPAGKNIQDLFFKQFPAELEKCKTNKSVLYKRENGDVFRVHADCINEINGQTKKIIVFENITSQEKWRKNLSETTTLLDHDLRVPLTAIKGYLTMLPVMGQLNQQQQSYIEKGIRQVDEMSDQIKHLFSLDRLNSGDGLLLENIEINKLINEIVSSQMPMAEQKRIDLSCDLSDSSKLIITGDRSLIKLAINRILENAIRFTANQGKISIRTGIVQNMAEIAIEDNGCGISAVDIQNIFEKSYRMKINASNETDAKGQSLALVKSIIKKHGGEIGVISELGKGSTFFIRLLITF